ncbi:VOC family protein [Myxococcota bacterium]|nr:VOC family protein [Myxococcota bacterium]MBU1899291.1 VOC family protein [Myxococcota bacterium]
MKIQKIHHVAYRCHDAQETIAFYQDLLGMRLVLAIAENQVPSTKAPDPYMHVFLDAGQGNILAFFELPNSPKMDRDHNTPTWVQHIAFELESVEALMEAKAKVEGAGLEVIGPTDHGIFKSIYFFDPNGHRLELAANTLEAGMLEELATVAPAMIAEWSRTKRAPMHAAWLHNGQPFQEFMKEKYGKEAGQ